LAWNQAHRSQYEVSRIPLTTKKRKYCLMRSCTPEFVTVTATELANDSYDDDDYWSNPWFYGH
jgi:hypothetical protein